MTPQTRPHSQLLLNTWDSFTSIAAQLAKHDDRTAQKPAVQLDGNNLDLAAVVAVSRLFANVEADPHRLDSLAKGSNAMQRCIANKEVIYVLLKLVLEGVNTGFGGSAGTRTAQVEALQQTLIRDLRYGVLPSSSSSSSSRHVFRGPGSPLAVFASSLPNEHPSVSCLPESWTRAALLIRANSLIRGHSAVRPIIVERILHLLQFNITPKIPMHGSISASGDLSPLSYVGAAIEGRSNSAVWASTPETKSLLENGDEELSAATALAAHGLPPITLAAKEGLAIVNGTAVSCAAGLLALHDAHGLALLSQVLTAMTVEALLGAPESFDPFFGAVRPHPGQIESAQNISHFISTSKLTKSSESAIGAGVLRQDRYSVRTASQWMGPVLEDLALAHSQLEIECNSTTDNPLMNEAGRLLNGGNFQAKSVTSAMEKIRQGVQTLGRMHFAQTTEMINPATNNGLPPNLVGEDPSNSFIFKGVDIGVAALASELGFLANPVGSHVQTAEMGNQALNSLALISARYTHTALDILSRLVASHMLAVCQALDLRAMRLLFLEAVAEQFKELNRRSFPGIEESQIGIFEADMWLQLQKQLDETSAMDTADRFFAVSGTLRSVVLDAHPPQAAIPVSLSAWRKEVAGMLERHYTTVRNAYFDHGDATPYLGVAAKKMYSFVRQELKVPFLHNGTIQSSDPHDISHNGVDTTNGVAVSNGASVPGHTRNDSPTVGTFVEKLYTSIRSGVMFIPAVECLREVS